MKVIKQIFIILLFYVLGEALAYGIHWLFPKVFIPGTILGLGLLLLALVVKLIPLKGVDDVGTFLTSNMAFFFIPAAVSVLEYAQLLKGALLQIVLIIVISLLLSFSTILLSVKLTLWIQLKIKERKNRHV